ncbi:hypothetical protein [Lederbergia sp. NSJ-179]|uniref:hypothetical protein n=1 Tax=Lederbergia sp. NSJ-179 TaxID=2931402 RepID=UPI0037C0F796
MRQGVFNGGVGVVAFIISNGRKILSGKPLFLINVCIFSYSGNNRLEDYGTRFEWRKS